MYPTGGGNAGGAAATPPNPTSLATYCYAPAHPVERHYFYHATRACAVDSAGAQRCEGCST